jgi:hypothetical protein
MSVCIPARIVEMRWPISSSQLNHPHTVHIMSVEGTLASSYACVQLLGVIFINLQYILLFLCSTIRVGGLHLPELDGFPQFQLFPTFSHCLPNCRERRNSDYG